MSNIPESIVRVPADGRHFSCRRYHGRSRKWTCHLIVRWGDNQESFRVINVVASRVSIRRQNQLQDSPAIRGFLTEPPNPLLIEGIPFLLRFWGTIPIVGKLETPAHAKRRSGFCVFSPRSPPLALALRDLLDIFRSSRGRVCVIRCAPGLGRFVLAHIGDGTVRDNSLVTVSRVNRRYLLPFRYGFQHRMRIIDVHASFRLGSVGHQRVPDGLDRSTDVAESEWIAMVPERRHEFHGFAYLGT